MPEPIESIYQNVLLSDAAYIDWERRPDEVGNDSLFEQRRIQSLVDNRGFTQNQAESFVDRYKVISHQPNTSAGFSATLFLDTKGTADDSDDEEVLAIRGTESEQDFFEDALIALGPEGQASRQFEDLKDFVQGLKDEDHLQKSFTVSGHSLGGHLATMLTLAAEDTGNSDPRLEGLNIDHTYTYNGAGLGTFIFGAGLVQLFENLLPGVDFNQPHENITNLFSTAGIELISNVGITFGETIPIFTENQGDAFDATGNHFIEHLTNSLSVYRLFDRLDPIESESDFQRVHDILSGASPEPTESLQSVIDDLGALFSINPANRDTEKSDEFFDELKTVLQGFPEGARFRVRSLVDANSGVSDIEDIFAPAGARNIAYRHFHTAPSSLAFE